MFNQQYEAQVRLLLSCLPDISRYTCFALKGGTAINLFMRDLPRISVDIDLTYLPLKPRPDALAEIHGTLLSIKDDLQRHLPESLIKEKHVENCITKLFVFTEEAMVKIEPNFVFRGFINNPQYQDLCYSAQEYFQTFVSVNTMSVADLYGSKLCAALDRQHPRDLFDVKLLLEGIGITPEIRRAFVLYLAGHNRPMSELLSPKVMDIGQSYEEHFIGMVRDEVLLDDLLEVQQILPGTLVQSLDVNEKEFLLSMKKGNPDWGLLGIKHISRLPALQWKLINIRKMDAGKRAASLKQLAKVLQD